MNAGEVGQRLPERRVVVSGAAMKTMAMILRDANPIHFDPAVLSALGLSPVPINQGPTNIAYLWELLGAWLGTTDGVRSLRARFVSNALAGEELVVSGEVAEVGADATATCSLWLRHADGTDVVTARAVVAL
jgi:acyl dehydratase